MTYRGKWHGDHVYFGMHYDLHAGPDDTVLGAHCEPEELIPSLSLMAPQWVQTDCKGHPGMTSWFTQTPTGTVSPGVVKDALAGWREATRRMGVPLHCHYSGIWDTAAAAKYPDWAVVPNPAREKEGPSEKMCPRGPYLDELLIPQLLELIDRYQVDGFWIDGDVWAVEACYCHRCLAAWKEQTGSAEPPTSLDDPAWPAWMDFHRQAYYAYVRRYVAAVHAHKEGVLVCSNWLQTFRDPGEPSIETDWISGDWWSGTDQLRLDARFVATRGKPWDLMLWAFHTAAPLHNEFGERAIPWTFSSSVRLEQQAAIILSQGGNVQLYEHGGTLRDGRLTPWRMQRLGVVGEYVKRAQPFCQGGESLPQIGVLHSEVHNHSFAVRNLYWDADAGGVEGAVYGLLEASYGVDILDEWALLTPQEGRPSLADLPLVVAAEQDRMSDTMVAALIDYVTKGGCLLLSGAALYERFGEEFLGCKSLEVKQDVRHFVSLPGAMAEMYSASWRLLQATTARALGTLGKTSLVDAELLPWPSAVLNHVGEGRVVYVPFDLFHFYKAGRYAPTRAFLETLVEALEPRLTVRAKAPACVDVVPRRIGGKTIIHLVNLAPFITNTQDGEEQDLPLVGPITLRIDRDAMPSAVTLELEGDVCSWTWTPRGDGGVVEVHVPQLRLHAAVVIA